MGRDSLALLCSRLCVTQNWTKWHSASLDHQGGYCDASGAGFVTVSGAHYFQPQFPHLYSDDTRPLLTTQLVAARYALGPHWVMCFPL